MINKWIRFLMFVFLVGLLSAWAVAQDSDTNANSKGEVRSITGCLNKGEHTNEYLLTANDGSSWEMHANNAVHLAKHVGHTVEVKGVVSHTMMHNMKEDAKGVAGDTGMKKNTAEHGHLKVTNLHMISDSCQHQ